MPRAPRWLFALKGVLAVVAVAVLVRLAHPANVWRAFADAEWGWALAALALVPVNVGLEAYRWGRLVRRLAPEVRHRDALRAVVGSYPLGLLTPGRVGDYVGRAVYLRAVPPGASAALTFGERMATLAACLVGGLAALGPYLRDAVAPSPLWPAVVGVGALGAGALVVAIAFPSVARAALSAVLPFEPVRRAVAAFDRIPREESVTLLALSGLRYLVFSTQFVLLVRAVDPGAALGGVALGVALVFFAKSAVPQVTLGDLGVREGAAVFFLGAYGVAPAAALDASLALFALNLVLPALAGVPFLLRLRVAAREAERVGGVAARGRVAA
ncbi:lysylphosphatidylglycerol synthase transmembrane domain-containing protein [Rubrivirga sp. S365]|uniref:Lysylphosphatidylglycerol synthase transmembrane domain-containing protein n=1 Tax=Rubrivirga litoralis TaxID=3075598 RepID=A0ABU3BMJ0_9BACT|nr:MULTISPECIES: lysylphosphatidylglycerol synthase transmembrane domain-containing protein [unclassified Rubrivirga]MDT0630502.1 lysylphosphatidylglycerol synthase transmembrane domain-containing protein [Rubrivirga sp. F394]MDT7857520.1 lysylphosphatidylglycerol synthase transmembrane domain-containing protein [Rubrivirga sp. S365]